MCLGNSIRSFNMLLESNRYDLKEILDDKSSTLFDTCGYSLVNDLNIEDHYNFNTMHLNIHSLLSKQSNLIDLLSRLKDKNCEIDVVALCETFLTKHKMSLINIPGYKIAFTNRLK